MGLIPSEVAFLFLRFLNIESIESKKRNDETKKIQNATFEGIINPVVPGFV